MKDGNFIQKFQVIVKIAKDFKRSWLKRTEFGQLELKK